LGQMQSSTYYTIHYGDTLESIALNQLGSTDYWKVIATFNNLAYPYITSTFPQPEKTVSPGQQIAIPIIPNTPNFQGTASNAGNIILSPFQTPPSINSSFGTDIYLDSTGDVDVTSNGDIKTVSGIPNLQQALSLKVTVYRGELLVHPDYGIINMLGERTITTLQSLILGQLEATFLSDPRVQKVISTSVNILGDTGSFESSILPNFNAPPIVLSGSLAPNN